MHSTDWGLDRQKGRIFVMINGRSTRNEWGGIASQRWEQQSSSNQAINQESMINQQQSSDCNQQEMGMSNGTPNSWTGERPFSGEGKINICFGVLALNILTSQHNP